MKQKEYKIFAEGSNRKSFILYYYTKDERPNDQNIHNKPHSTLWVKKNLNDKKVNISRDFE